MTSLMPYVFGLSALLLSLVLAQGFQKWRGQLDLFLLLVAVMVNGAWAGASALVWPHTPLNLPLLGFLEHLRYLTLAALLVHLFASATGGYGRLLVRARWALGIAAGGAALALIAGLGGRAPEDGSALSAAERIHATGLLLIASAMLWLLIRAAASQTTELRRLSRTLWLGLLLLLGTDVACFAMAALAAPYEGALAFRAWMVIPAAAALFMALRHPRWSQRAHLSHSALFSFTLGSTSIAYVAAVCAGVVALKAWHGHWTALAQLAVLLLAAVLLGFYLSEPHRAQLRVFFNKHFFNYKYDYRDQWLRFIRTLSRGGPGAHLLETVIEALAQIVGSRGGSLWLRADHGPYELAASNPSSRPAAGREAADSSLVSFLTTWQWVIDVDEYARDPDLYQDLTLPEWLGSHPDAWLVVPLMQDVELLGFVVIDRAPAAHAINWEDHDLLKTAGRQAATHLAQLMAVQALVEAREFQAFSRLSAFVIHDLKNLVAQLSLVVTNAAKHKRNPAFMEDAIGTVENCVTKMNRLLAQLRKGKTQPGKAAALNLGTALREVVQQRQEQEPRPTLETSGPTLTVLADHDRLTAVLTHLIQNAQEATASDGWVRVKAWRSGALVHIEIADNGCGMDANFIRDRLFRPFDSTKGQGGMGIGAYESRDYVRELGGDIDVASQPGQGSTFLISLPGSWDGAT